MFHEMSRCQKDNKGLLKAASKSRLACIKQGYTKAFRQEIWEVGRNREQTCQMQFDQQGKATQRQ